MGNLHENETMPPGIQGATLPSEIWRKFMSAVLVNTPPADFPPEPADLWGGKYLTSWGGTSGDYTNQGQGNTGTDTGSGPSTTAAQSGPSTTTGRRSGHHAGARHNLGAGHHVAAAPRQRRRRTPPRHPHRPQTRGAPG